MRLIFVLLLVSISSVAGDAVSNQPTDKALVAEAKPVKKAAAPAVGGREVTSTKDLYAAMPGEAKESKVVGGLVKNYSGNVDILCAKDTYVCIVTFKDKK